MDGDRFFTYGWGAAMARYYKKFNPETNVECWKTDPRIRFMVEKEIDGLRYIMFPAFNIRRLGQFSWSMLRQIRKRRKENNILFQISGFRHLLFYSTAALLSEKPLVVQNHGESTAIYKVSTKHFIKKIGYYLLRPLEKKGIRNTDLIYVLDKELSPFLPQVKPMPVVRQSTVGVDSDLFVPVAKEEARKILKLDQTKKYILYIGRLNYTKRTDILFDVYSQLLKSRNDIALICAGTEKSDILYSRAIKSGALISGTIPQADIKLYLSAADVYVLPKYSENHAFGGIGMLPVQSILCNTPVVGESLRNFPEADRSKVGINANDAEGICQGIQSIIDHPGKYSNIREYAEKYYSWKNICKRTSGDYTVLLKKYYGQTNN